MEVGDIVKVYDKIRTDVEKCSLGGMHDVPIYEVKFLTVRDIIKEMIKALNYSSDGIGNVYYAVDAQNRIYTKRDHWDGPRATLWLRTNDHHTFDQYPQRVFSRDLTGRALDL